MILKWFFKAFTSFHVMMYRLTGGRFGGSMRGFNVLLLTTTGRKSGKQRTTPLGYIRDGAAYVIIASNGGQERHPAWYFNMQSNPNVEIQVRDQVLKLKADTAQGDERSRLWAQLIREAPAYQEYEKVKTREVPVVVLRA